MDFRLPIILRLKQNNTVEMFRVPIIEKVILKKYYYVETITRPSEERQVL